MQTLIDQGYGMPYMRERVLIGWSNAPFNVMSNICEIFIKFTGNFKRSACKFIIAC